MLSSPTRATLASLTVTSASVRFSLGTAWPLAALNPMLTLSAGKAQNITAAQALSAHTNGSAFAEYQETEKGTLARGTLGDLAILGDDVLSIPPAQVKDVKVLATIVPGKVVHQRKR